MRRTSIRVNKRDAYRVLLTELLPFETPLFFSNEGFYRYCRKQLRRAPDIVKRLLGDVNASGVLPAPSSLRTAPYLFEIRKGALETRTMGVMHPRVQRQFVEFYRRYAHTILHLCGRSRFALRYPEAVESAFYWPDEAGEGGTQHSSTYFRYEKYDRLHKFYDSYEFHRLEKRFRHLQTFDISQCFSSIYTHSFSWAVRRKSFAKAHRQHRTFDSEFDSLMRAANDDETAGILIGPEVSRLFAEIILQRIDMNVLSRLHKDGKQEGRDFEVRRYVDDYFVFTADRELAIKIMETYRDEMRPFRLHINMQKLEDMTVPFMTHVSCAKQKLKVIIDEFFSLRWNGEPCGGEAGAPPGFRVLRRPAGAGDRLIRQIKMEVKTHGVDYVGVCHYMLAIMEGRVRRLLEVPHENSPESQKDDAAPFLLALLDAAFFVYAMDVRVTTTDKVARLVQHVTKFATCLGEAAAEQVKKKMYDELLHVLKTDAQRASKQYVETLNLLPVLRLLGEEYQIPSETMDQLVKELEEPRQDYEPVRYFLIVALLFHIGHDPKSRYTSQKERILSSVIDSFKGEEDPLRRADCTCLLFDILSCPYLDLGFKERLVDEVRWRGKPLTPQEKRDILAVIPSVTWFSDWNARDRVPELLEKRRYRTPY